MSSPSTSWLIWLNRRDGAGILQRSWYPRCMATADNMMCECGEQATKPSLWESINSPVKVCDECHAQQVQSSYLGTETVFD